MPKTLNWNPKRNLIKGIRYICQICAYSARTNHILKEHIADVHEGRKKPGVICPICGCCLAQKHYLKIHIAQVHEGKKAYPFTCDTCGHGSSRLMDLKGWRTFPNQNILTYTKHVKMPFLTKMHGERILLTTGFREKEAWRPTPKWNTRFFFAFSKRTQLWLP